MSSYNAKVKKSNATSTLKRKEHCSADPEKLATIGRAVGHQVRIERNENAYALYTVSETQQGEPDNVVRMTEKALSRLGSDTSDEFDAIVKAQVLYCSYKNDEANEEACKEAKAKNEFIECLKDNGTHKGLIVIAPHGGGIEPHTDKQAEFVAARLKNISCWRCKGWKKNGGASKRWHITSADIHEASFPLLNTVIDRKFKYAVSFHGFKENCILVGGLSKDALKEEIKIAIQNAIPSEIEVKIAARSTPNGGRDPENIVNRLARECNGIQIEQSKDARKCHWQEIAEAVSLVFRDKI